MDDKWFKTQQKRIGVTADEIAQKLGRDRSLVSRIYVGRQAMKLQEAKVFADVLQVPLDEVLKRAGVLDEATSHQVQPGFSEGHAAPFDMSGSKHRRERTIAETMGQRAGVDPWQITSSELTSIGYRKGDFILVDTHQSETARSGDTVVCQSYDWETGDAKTLIGEFYPPVIFENSADPDRRKAHVVDGRNVAIRGKVIASWRV